MQDAITAQTSGTPSLLIDRLRDGAAVIYIEGIYDPRKPVPVPEWVDRRGSCAPSVAETTDLAEAKPCRYKARELTSRLPGETYAKHASSSGSIRQLLPAHEFLKSWS
jgi:hypothetical protein